MTTNAASPVILALTLFLVASCGEAPVEPEGTGGAGGAASSTGGHGGAPSSATGGAGGAAVAAGGHGGAPSSATGGAGGAADPFSCAGCWHGATCVLFFDQTAELCGKNTGDVCAPAPLSCTGQPAAPGFQQASRACVSSGRRAAYICPDNVCTDAACTAVVQ
jgi:hypothetical protein